MSILNENDLRNKINKISQDTNSDIVFINCNKDKDEYEEYKNRFNIKYEQSITNNIFYNRYKDIVKDEEYFIKIGLNGICVIFIKEYGDN